MRTMRVFALIVLVALACQSNAAFSQPAPAPDPQQAFTPGELINAGHRFFGTVSRGLATVIEQAVSLWGQPNGYVLGEEAGGAFFRRSSLRRRHERVLAAVDAKRVPPGRRGPLADGRQTRFPTVAQSCCRGTAAGVGQLSPAAGVSWHASSAEMGQPAFSHCKKELRPDRG